MGKPIVIASPNPRLKPLEAAASADDLRGGVRGVASFGEQLARNDGQKLAVGIQSQLRPTRRPVLGAWRCAFGGNGVEWLKENGDRALSYRRGRTRIRASVREAWVGSQNTSIPRRCARWSARNAHSRSRITQLLRFMRSATCTSSRRLLSFSVHCVVRKINACTRAISSAALPPGSASCAVRPPRSDRANATR